MLIQSLDTFTVCWILASAVWATKVGPGVLDIDSGILAGPDMSARHFGVGGRLGVGGAFGVCRRHVW
jgi:hypothetical protein